MKQRKSTIFVTGGAGFIGSAVIRHLLDHSQAAIVNIDKLTYAADLSSIPQTNENNPHYAFHKTDICDGPALRELFTHYCPDGVINLAAETHVDRSIDSPREFIHTNVVGTFTLLQEALRYWRRLKTRSQATFRLVHVSTDEVYGSLADDRPFTEMAPYAPSSPYAASKASSDHLVRAWHKTYGLPTIVTNASNNYGPYQFPEKLIPHAIIKGLSEQPIPLYGDGLHVRDWLYVEDHARALSLVLERGRSGETYSEGGRNERANKEVVTATCEQLDHLLPPTNGPRRELITLVTDRPGHDRRYAIDPSKIERELGWQPAETFESGLAKTVRWFCENRDWWQAIIERGYKAKRLGLIRQAC
ncbi:MAG: dTDP-glucose 4,6-dehydratase [Xanthobacteraceae bacterium]